MIWTSESDVQVHEPNIEAYISIAKAFKAQVTFLSLVWGISELVSLSLIPVSSENPV